MKNNNEWEKVATIKYCDGVYEIYKFYGYSVYFTLDGMEYNEGHFDTLADALKHIGRYTK